MFHQPANPTSVAYHRVRTLFNYAGTHIIITNLKRYIEVDCRYHAWLYDTKDMKDNEFLIE